MITIEARVGRLEKSLAKWKAGVVVAMVVGLALGMMAQMPGEKVTKFDVVEARAFKVVDAKGNTQGLLDYNPSADSSRLSLGEGRERPFIRMESTKAVAHATVYGEKIGDKASLFASPGDGGQVRTTRDVDGKNEVTGALPK